MDKIPEEKKIEDYLHLYLGCEVEYGSEDDKQKGILTGVDSFSVYTANIKLTHVPIQLVKPILRPLSAITHDEDEKAWEIWNEDFVKAMGVNCGTAYEAGKIKYLLSRSFDLFGLIDAGLAIDRNSHP